MIRAALPTEAKIISALALRSKAHWDYSAAFIKSFREELTYTQKTINNSQFHFFVKEIAGAIVGFYCLFSICEDQFELEALFVEPERIGRGIGRELLDHAKSQVSRLGCRSFIIQSDPNAEKFYLSAGAKVTDKRESGSIPGRYLSILTINLE